MKKVVIILLFFTITSCSSGLKLCFENRSTENFKNLNVKIDTIEYKFYDLKSNETTQPISVKGTFPYCPTEIITEKGDTIRFFPIDYIGEKFHKSGKLKIILTISESDNNKNIDFTIKK